MNDNNILFICSGHQDSDSRLEHVLGNLKKLSDMNIDICYTTHCSNGLEKISKYCKYLIYDSNNLFPNESDLFNNLESISLEKFEFLLTSYKDLPIGKINNRLFLTHSKPALSNFRNGVYTAINKNYSWIVYIEYDIVLPEIDILKYFKDKVEYLNSNNLEGDFYHCVDERHPLIWPHFFICRPEIFRDDVDFNSNLESSEDFIKIYANRFFEQILNRIVRSKNNVIIRSGDEIINDLNFNIDNSIICDQGVLSKFSSSGKNSDINELDLTSSKNHSPWNIELYTLGNNDEYGLNLVIHSLGGSNEIYKLNYLNISDDNSNSLLTLNDMELKINNWYSFNILSNYRIKSEIENIYVEYSIEMINVKKINVSYKLNLNSLDKYKHLRFIN